MNFNHCQVQRALGYARKAESEVRRILELESAQHMKEKSVQFDYGAESVDLSMGSARRDQLLKASLCELNIFCKA